MGIPGFFLFGVIAIGVFFSFGVILLDIGGMFLLTWVVWRRYMKHKVNRRPETPLELRKSWWFKKHFYH
jgi:hypothetical protein